MLEKFCNAVKLLSSLTLLSELQKTVIFLKSFLLYEEPSFASFFIPRKKKNEIFGKAKDFTKKISLPKDHWFILLFLNSEGFLVSLLHLLLANLCYSFKIAIF